MKRETNSKNKLTVILIIVAGGFYIAKATAQVEKGFHADLTNSIKVAPGKIAGVSNASLYKPDEISDTDLIKQKGEENNPNSGLPVYTLEKCFEIALEKNTAVKKAQNDIEANITDRKTAQYSLLPSVSYDMGHYFSFGKNIDPVTNTFSYESFSGGYAGLGLELDLFAGFKKINEIKQSAFMVKSAKYSEKKTALELLTNITLIYARLLSNKEELKNKRGLIENIFKEITIINEKIKVGRLSKYELYAFDARLSSEKAELITLQNDSAATAQDLKQVMNISYNEKVDIDSISDTMLSNIFATDFSQSNLLEKIISNHPAIKQAETIGQAASMRVKMARSNYLPVLSVGGNIVSNYSSDQKDINGGKIPLSSQLNNNLGKNIIVSLRIPVFSRMENAGLVKKEKLNLSNAQLDIENVKNSIITAIIHLTNDFTSSKEKYKARQSSFAQNILSYDLYREKYRLGQVSSVELIAAQDILNAAASKYIEAKLQLFFRFQLLQLLKTYSAE